MTAQQTSPRIFSTAHRQGLSVFPLQPRGSAQHTRPEEYLERDPTAEELANWDANDLNLGVLCTPGYSVAVIEIDAQAKGRFNAMWLPETPMLRTPNGWQAYFEHPGFPLQNISLQPGIRLWANHCYVVGPGSLNRAGQRYEWVISPDEIPYSFMTTRFLRMYAETARQDCAELRAQPIHQDHVLITEGEATCLAVALRELDVEDDRFLQSAIRLTNHSVDYDALWIPSDSWLASAADFAGIESTKLDPVLKRAREIVECSHPYGSHVERAAAHYAKIASGSPAGD